MPHTLALRDQRLLDELRACPGERVLILGNHNTALLGLAEACFTTQHRRAL